MKIENLKGGFKVWAVIIAVLAIAATSFSYTYSKATTDLRKTLETVKLVGLDSTGVTFTVDNPTDVPIRIETINLTIYVNETVFGRCFQSFIPKLQHVNPGAKGRAFYVHVPYWLAYSDIFEKNGTHSLKITGEVTASATYLFITVYETLPHRCTDDMAHRSLTNTDPVSQIIWRSRIFPEHVLFSLAD